ncbi:hypothetical protein [Kitasatospora sp. NPDC015120]|uniref:hypothetical protein n=1 Tax=Kitasatospora sp. NPDC015120 TaxID=3364023 RepID=UPI0036F476A1
MRRGRGGAGRVRRRGPTAKEWGNLVTGVVLGVVLLAALYRIALLLALVFVALHFLVLALPRLLLRHARAVRSAFGAGAPPPPATEDGAAREPYLRHAGAQALRAVRRDLRKAYEEQLRAALRWSVDRLAPPDRAWGRGELFTARCLCAVFGALRATSVGTAVLVSMLLALPALLCQLLARAALLAGFRLWWTACRAADGLGRRLTGSARVCPHPACGRAVELPVRLCPRCGVRHRRLVPDRYGGLRRTCRCGARLPAGSLFGAWRLEARCPHCSRPVPPGGSPTRLVLVAGSAGAGRSTVVRSGFAHLAGVVGALGGRVGGAPAGAAVAELSGLRGGRRTLVLLDPPGPVFEEQSGLDALEGLRRAHGLVLVLDALTLPSVRRALPGGSASPAPGSVPAAERVLRSVGALPRRRRPRRIAVVLTRTAALRATPAGPGPDPGAGGEEAVRRWLEEAGAGNLVRVLERTGGRLRFLADGPGSRAGPDLGEVLLWTAGVRAAPRRRPAPHRVRPAGGPRIRPDGTTARARHALLLSHLPGLAVVPLALTLLFTGTLPPTAAFGLPAAVDRWQHPLPDFARDVDLTAFRGDGSWPALTASYSAPGSSPDGPRAGRGGHWSTEGGPDAAVPDGSDGEAMDNRLPRPEWLEIDFGVPVPVSRLELDMEPGIVARATVETLAPDGVWVRDGRQELSGEDLLAGRNRRFTLGGTTTAVRIVTVVLPGHDGVRVTRLRTWSPSTTLLRPRLSGTDLLLTNTANRDVRVEVLPPVPPPGWRAEPAGPAPRRVAGGATVTSAWRLTPGSGARPGPVGYAVRVTEDGRTATVTCVALLRTTPQGVRTEPLACGPD